MHLTRLHFILIFILMSAIGLFIAQRLQKLPGETETAQLADFGVKEQAATEATQTEQSPHAAEPSAGIEEIARKAVAVAGEYWKIAKREGRDISGGQSTLREAKKNYSEGRFAEAVELARQAITEFKTAPVKADLSYIVRRGDNLWKIAKLERHYGKGAMWVKVWRANESKIPDFDMIFSGQNLLIPR